MAGETATATMTCPHCHESFQAALLDGRAGRLRGFKCPHCKLFVPESRAEDTASAPLTRDSGA